MLAAAPLAAQQPDSARAARDTAAVPGDSVARRDTLPADTIKAPLPVHPAATAVWAGPAMVWDREALARSGAFTLDELIAHVPGVNAYRAGWLASPALVAVAGDVSRVRVFLDGLELESLAPGDGGLLDLSRIQLWTLEAVAVERGADAVRVYLTSWRVDRTASSTRTDVMTGDQDTNLYRGFFGRRFARGEVIQLGAQQYGYQSGTPLFGGGDELSLMGRLGIGREMWALDAFVLRASRNRDAQPDLSGAVEIPDQDGRRTDAYARLTIGRAMRGAWLQLLAGRQQVIEELAPASGSTGTRDTTLAATQYLATAGFARGAFRAVLTGRAHEGDLRPERDIAGEARLSLDTRYLAIAARADVRDADTVSVEEVAVALRPTSWLTLAGSAARRHGGASDFEQRSARAELGLRLFGLWAIGGILVADTAQVLAPAAPFGTFDAVADASAPRGVYGAVRGRVWRDLYLDGQVTRWEESGWYRPQLSGYGQAYIDTRWLGRFPSGSFGFRGAAGFHYRERVAFPVAAASTFATEVNELRFLAELRLLDGAIFFQQRLRVQPAQTTIVPGFVLPRQNAIYGVRWQFWN